MTRTRRFIAMIALASTAVVGTGGLLDAASARPILRPCQYDNSCLPPPPPR